MRKTVLCFISILLTVAFLLNLAGCNDGITAQNLMKDITQNNVRNIDDLSTGNIAMTDFAVRLFKECEASGENILISPLSVMYALAMTANGADGETLSQMETVLGMPLDDLNEYLYTYKNSLPQGEKYKLNLANSIWFKDGLNVKQDFLQTNADYYNIDIYKAPFDNSTLKDINNWVNTKTNEMIPKLIDSISKDMVMYLINALTFEAEWAEKYPEQKITEGIFTREDKTEQNITFMHSNEYVYLEGGKARGFIKHYADDKYAFVAMLPDKDITVSEYISSLDGDKLNALLSNQKAVRVGVVIPRFVTEYTVELPDILKKMGMTDAFISGVADFNKIDGGYDLWVSEVTHKTFIDVNENGTTAAAATRVALKKNILKTEKTVYLDRPFVYMIIDCQNNVPIFMGTVMSVES